MNNFDLWQSWEFQPLHSGFQLSCSSGFSAVSHKRTPQRSLCSAPFFSPPEESCKLIFMKEKKKYLQREEGEGQYRKSSSWQWWERRGSARGVGEWEVERAGWRLHSSCRGHEAGWSVPDLSHLAVGGRRPFSTWKWFLAGQGNVDHGHQTEGVFILNWPQKTLPSSLQGAPGPGAVLRNSKQVGRSVGVLGRYLVIFQSLCPRAFLSNRIKKALSPSRGRNSLLCHLAHW